MSSKSLRLLWSYYTLLGYLQAYWKLLHHLRVQYWTPSCAELPEDLMDTLLRYMRTYWAGEWAPFWVFCRLTALLGLRGFWTFLAWATCGPSEHELPEDLKLETLCAALCVWTC